MMMRVSMSMYNQTMSSLLDIPSCVLNSDLYSPRRHKEKAVLVMGATGAGKSRLSVELATRFPAEIINSDKIQVHEGLDILTNKITEEEQCGIRHHLLGVIHPNADFTTTNFIDMASNAMDSITSRSQLPIIAGGSNSFVEALVDDEDRFRFRSKYECCILWVDVAMPVLYQYVSNRVDKMIENGMVDELRSYFNSNANHSRGIGKAIGVHEFDNYFRVEPFLNKRDRAKLVQQAIQDIKRNTCGLAYRQTEKIRRLRNKKNWKIHRLDVTEVFRKHGEEADEAWEELVAGPSTEIVAQFLCDISSGALLTSPTRLQPLEFLVV